MSPYIYVILTNVKFSKISSTVEVGIRQKLCHHSFNQAEQIVSNYEKTGKFVVILLKSKFCCYFVKKQVCCYFVKKQVLLLFC